MTYDSVKFLIRTIDHYGFDKESDIIDKAKRGNYDNLRSHGYQILQICDMYRNNLGLDQDQPLVIDISSNGTRNEEALRGTDFGILLEKGFDSLPIGGAPIRRVKAEMDGILRKESQNTKRVLFLVQMLINYESRDALNRLLEGIRSVDEVIIYTSDYDFEVRDVTFGKDFISKFLMTDLDKFSINDIGGNLYQLQEIRNELLGKGKLKFVCNGWYHVHTVWNTLLKSKIITEYNHEVESFYLPQMIVPTLRDLVKASSKDMDFDEFISQKIYHMFNIGINDYKKDLLQLLPSGQVDEIDRTTKEKIFSIQYRSENLPIDSFRKVTQFLQAGTGTEFLPLINMAKLCKFHIVTNSWESLYPELARFDTGDLGVNPYHRLKVHLKASSIKDASLSDMIHNHTFKIFEAYYAGMYPIPPNIPFVEFLRIINRYTDKDLFVKVKKFREDLEKSFSPENFLDTFSAINSLVSDLCEDTSRSLDHLN